MTGPLERLRVRERTDGLAATFAGHLLAGLGAQVTRDAAGPHPILDRRKRVGTVASPDVSLVDERDADDDAAIGASVHHWGRRGPRVTLPPDESLVQAVAGIQRLQWSWTGRPVWLATPIVSYMTGMLTALGTVAAQLGRRRGLPGQRVEVSALQGAFALNSGTYVTGPAHQSALMVGGDPRGVYPSYSLYPTADGWLFLGALTQPFWVKLMTFLERVDLLVDERLQGNPLTFGAPGLRAFVRAELEPIFRQRRTAAWVEALRRADIPCGAVQSRERYLEDPEVRAAGLVAEPWEPPSAVRIADGDPVERGVIATPRGACLDGIRVLDLTSFIAGPVCPMLLADLGADVVKVESTDGDPFRMTLYGFHGWNRGKRSIVLDLKRREGRDVLLDLVRGADVVVENFRDGVLDRLGLGWDQLRAVRPGVVLASITGAEGPLATLPGFDPIFQARSGFMMAQGGGEPVFHMIPYNDYCAGTLAALGVVTALVAREERSCGQRVQASLMRTALVGQAAHMTDVFPGGRDYLGPSAARRLYGCADGWLCVAAQRPEEVRGLADLADMALGAADPADGPSARRVAERLERSTRAEALDRLRDLGIPAAPCLDFTEMCGDAHLLANDLFVTMDDATLGPVTLGGPPIGFESTPITYRRLGPAHGEHGAEILREIGYDAARVAQLAAAGVTHG